MCSRLLESRRRRPTPVPLRNTKLKRCGLISAVRPKLPHMPRKLRARCAEKKRSRRKSISPTSPGREMSSRPSRSRRKRRHILRNPLVRSLRRFVPPVRYFRRPPNRPPHPRPSHGLLRLRRRLRPLPRLRRRPRLPRLHHPNLRSSRLRLPRNLLLLLHRLQRRPRRRRRPALQFQRLRRLYRLAHRRRRK
jgi:hypothetical protein